MHCAPSCPNPTPTPSETLANRDPPTTTMAWNPPGKHSDPAGAPPPSRLDLRGLLPGPGSLLWTGVVLGGWLALSSVVMVGQGREAVISRLGQPARVVQPGLHFKLPWPLERATDIDAGARTSVSDTLPVVVGDPAMFDLPLQVDYAIDDPLRYIANGGDVAKDALKRLARDAVSMQVAAGSLSTLGGRDGQLDAQALANLQARAQRAGLGLKPLAVTWLAPVLPGVVRESGDALKAIQDDRERAVADAKADAAKQLPVVQAEADAMLVAAGRERDARVLDARGDAAHFRALAAQYKAAPIVTRDVVLQSAIADAATAPVAGDAAPVPTAGAAAATPASAPVSPADESSRPLRDASRAVDRSVNRDVDRSRSGAEAQR